MGSNSNQVVGTSPTLPLTAPSLYPSISKAALALQYVGKSIKDVQAPAAIIDAAVVRRNCKLMLETTKALGVEWRAHVKTHKTVEIAKLQVGKTGPVKLVCSTVSEIENLLPWLSECKTQGRDVNVLYGLPVSLSAIPRLAAVARLLGEGTIGLFTDHPSHIRALDKVETQSWPGLIPVWVTIDVGDHREGVPANSTQLSEIAESIAASKRVRLVGVYTHSGTSYSSSSPEEALKYLASELSGLQGGAASFLKSAGTDMAKDSNSGKIGLSLGATPTVTSAQNLLEDTEGAKEYKTMIESAKKIFVVELHAGVYPVMDMQQMATRARPRHSTSNPSQSLLSYSDLGFRVLAEVASLYLDRCDKPEALIAAGSVVLGREPCKSYSGWAVVTPWPSKSGEHYDPEGLKTGWIVGRISQEHGVLTWEGPTNKTRQLEVGQKLLLWPNHACIAGVNFGWYLVVDSDTSDPDRVHDVWLRWRGW